MAAESHQRQPEDDTATGSISVQSGGVNAAGDLQAGGDVVGRDKVESAGGHIIHAEPGATVIVGAPPAPVALAAEEAPAPGEPPFKGLQYFDEKDADLFYGRESLTARLVARLSPSPDSSGEGWGGGRFLAVVGASGSGKSSLVRAGLVPALRRGEAISGSVRWPIHVIAPTAHPLKELAATLTRDSESVTATAITGVLIIAGLLAITALIFNSQANEYARLADDKATIAAQAQKAEQLARARLLVAQGEAAFEDEPLLGLRLALEGLVLVSADDEETRASIIHSITDMAKWGRLLKLGNDIGAVHPNSDGSLFILDHSTGADELRRTADGSLVATFTGEVDDVYFSPDLDATYFVVDCRDAPGELRRTADGALVATLTGTVDNLYFSRDPDATYFVVDYRDAPGELRRTADGAIVATLTGEVFAVDFSPDPDATYFVVQHADGRREIWAEPDDAHLLTDLGLGRDYSFFDLQNGRFVVSYTDGRAYLLDLEWLQAMRGNPLALKPEDLVRFACQGPLASGLYDEADLKPYLGDQPPQACR